MIKRLNGKSKRRKRPKDKRHKSKRPGSTMTQTTFRLGDISCDGDSNRDVSTRTFHIKIVLSDDNGSFKRPAQFATTYLSDVMSLHLEPSLPYFSLIGKRLWHKGSKAAYNPNTIHWWFEYLSPSDLNLIQIVPNVIVKIIKK